MPQFVVALQAKAVSRPLAAFQLTVIASPLALAGTFDSDLAAARGRGMHIADRHHLFIPIRPILLEPIYISLESLEASALSDMPFIVHSFPATRSS